jgi:hypothetical protein
MNQRHLATAAVVVLVVAAFAGGVVAGSMGFAGIRPPLAIGSGYVGDHVVTFMNGDTGYGVKNSVAWRDAAGTEHFDGWPDCLPATTAVAGIPFIGATVWHDGLGVATILWIDCSGRD